MARSDIIILLISLNAVSKVVSSSDDPSQTYSKLSTLRCLVFEAVQEVDYTPSLDDHSACKNKNGVNVTERCSSTATVVLEKNIIILPDGEICEYNQGFCNVKGRLATWQVRGFLNHYIYSGHLDLWKIESTKLELEVVMLAHENITFNLVIKNALNKEFWNTMETGIYVQLLPADSSDSDKWNMTLFNKYFGVMRNRALNMKIENKSTDRFQKITKISSRESFVFEPLHSAEYSITSSSLFEEDYCESNGGFYSKDKKYSRYINDTKVTGFCRYIPKFDMEKNILEFPKGKLCNYLLSSCNINNRNVNWTVEGYMGDGLYHGFLDMWKIENSQLNIDLTVLAHQNVTFNLILNKQIKNVERDVWSTTADGVYVVFENELFIDNNVFIMTRFEKHFGDVKERKLSL